MYVNTVPISKMIMIIINLLVECVKSSTVSLLQYHDDVVLFDRKQLLKIGIVSSA